MFCLRIILFNETEFSFENSQKASHARAKIKRNDTTCICALFSAQDPNADTEWNDILRKKGILPPKEEPKDDEEEELALQQQSVGKIDCLG